jgi:dihydroxy-acid dehydratase
MRRGLPNDAFDGRPHIAIANTASDLTPCNSHLNEVMEHVKNGIWEAGGVPLNMPSVSLGETQMRPTAMLWRNMAAMATEEMIRANPIDGVVLLGGCDKTIPALLMAAASVDLPALVVPGGPMLTGTFEGNPIGCGTDVWRLSEDVRAKKLSEAKFLNSESSMIRSRGHCNTMGTASTMGSMAEAKDIIKSMMKKGDKLPSAQGKSVTAPPPAQQKPKPATPTPPKGKAGIEKFASF